MDLPLTPAAIALVAVAIAIAGLLVGLWLARWWAGHRSRARNDVAQRGEAEAERILESAGFRIVARQAVASWRLTIDGDSVDVGVRVDFIVERRRQRYVAEVKTGSRAPDPTLPATRRQLLEYSLVFGAAHVLLVDVPSRTIHAVSFPEVDVAA